MLKITNDNLDSITDQKELSVIVFSAEWCKPCKILKRTINEIEPNYPGITFGECDIDKERDVSSKCQIRSVPHVCFFYAGHVLESFIGNRYKDRIIEILDKLLTIE